MITTVNPGLLRVRIAFSKMDELRYIGHLDLFRAWERTFRRSGLPLAYSQGFHPQPRLNLACALPLGMTSSCEVLDAWLEKWIDLSQVKQSLEQALPPGLAINTIEVADLHASALQTQVVSAVYRIVCLDPIPDLDIRLQQVTSALLLPRQRRGKTYDLRPLIEGLRLSAVEGSGLAQFQAQLAAREGATGRPEELLDELAIKFEDTRVHREKLIFS